MADPADPYKVLQVDPEAEDEVVQAAYRRLARKYHPDVAPGPEAAARMAAINAAWDRLGDPVARATYDKERSVRLAHAAEVARAAAHRRRGWTTRSAPGFGDPAIEHASATRRGLPRLDVRSLR